MKMALLIGIDHYDTAPLSGCINDAQDMATLLETHANGSQNFSCKVVTSNNKASTTRKALREKIRKWFEKEADVSLLFFSGHGHLTSSGGILVTSDAENYDEGINMDELIGYVNEAAKKKRHRQIIIILDCCHSGRIGNLNNESNSITIEEGVSILTASGKDEEAMEGNRNGVFTSILLEAIKGEAADLLGNVSVANLYTYANQLLGVWEQRPRLKSNVQRMASLRSDQPKIPLHILRKLKDHFPDKDFRFPLDETYEPYGPDGKSENPKAIKEHVDVFVNELRQYNRFGLVEPYDLPPGKNTMYFAAILKTGCRLTFIGKFYWRMAKGKKL